MLSRLEQQARWRAACFVVNEAFRWRLLGPDRNRWCEQVVTDLRTVMKLNRHHALFKQGRLAEPMAEHPVLIQPSKHATRRARCG